MQRHKQHEPAPKKPDPRGRHTKWLLLVIALLLGLITARVLNRLLLF